MIEVELPDGRIVEFPEGTSQETMRAALMKMTGAQPQGGAMATAADMAKAGAAGISRGVTGLLDLPNMIGDLGEKAIVGGINKAFGTDLISRPSSIDFGGAASALTGGATDYQGKTTAGKYAGTVGEFLPGAAIGGTSAGNLLRYGVGAGLGSEAAGQMTEGTALEPYARVAGSMIAPALTARAGMFAGNDEMAKMANRVRDAGVKGLTAGQAKGSTGLMRAEGMLQPTSQQLDDYTASIMRQIGSSAPKATPEALRAAEGAIVKQMDDAVAGLQFAPDLAKAKEAANVAMRYVERVPAGQLTPRVKGIANEIIKSARSKSPIDLSRLKEWRSDIGKLTVSPDAATREAAHSLRGMIDDMTDAALVAAGRETDIANLSAGREAYRNFIGVRDAASRAGAETGTLSPTALNQSVIRSQGREAYATGRTTPMSELTRAGASVLRPAPSVMAGGERSFSNSIPAILGATAGAAGYQTLGPAAGAAGVLAGLLAPTAGQAAMRSGPIQAALRNPQSIPAGASRLLSGLLSQGNDQ